MEKIRQNLVIPIFESELSEKFLQMETKKRKLRKKLYNWNDDKLKDKIENEKESIERQINEWQIEQNKIINLKEKRKEVIESISNNKQELISDKNGNFILITIQNIQKELDGFFTTKEKIKIKNNYSFIEIPNNSIIVVEVKNHKKFEDICKNIKIKKTF